MVPPNVHIILVDGTQVVLSTVVHSFPQSLSISQYLVKMTLRIEYQPPYNILFPG